MNKYLLQGTLVAKPGSRDELTEILKRASRLMREKAKGCEMYAVGHSASEPNTVFVTELWASKEDHDASLAVDGVRELIGEAMNILAEMPKQGKEITVVNI